MDMPEDLRELVDQFGQAMIQALAVDPECRKLARQIQNYGYDIGLMLEATVMLQERKAEVKSSEVEEEPDFTLQTNLEDVDSKPAEAPKSTPWSESDRAFLKTFKISLD